MKLFIGWGISLTLLALGIKMPPQTELTTSVEMTQQDRAWVVSETSIDFPPTSVIPPIVFSHGDISWLPELATEAGWPVETHERLGEIILRESGGCPNRRGGDAVDGDCNITRVTEWNHRSDTGLLQINGVNYNPKRNKFALACTQLQICTQKPLLDPLNNLKVGYLLYEAAGWGPWDPCTWGKEWAHRCVKSNP